MTTPDLDTEVRLALALLHQHLRLAQALVDTLVILGASPKHVAWARAELDQLQATGHDISARHGAQYHP